MLHFVTYACYVGDLMANSNLSAAKNAKNDEYYTRYEDIQKEINAYLEYNPDTFRDKVVLLPCDDPEWSNFTKFFAQNFDNFGLKKLISTSFAANSKTEDVPYQITFFEMYDEKFDKEKTRSNGKIFSLTRDKNKSGKIDIDDLEWHYLNGDGDFRSDEIKALRDEADIIVTNPPFSLFREFISWIVEANKLFLILGNPNLISKREIFPLFAKNKIWVGCKSMSTDAYFIIPDTYKERLLKENKEGSGYKTIDGVIYGRTQAIWYTNLDHGRRHSPLSLMSMNDNMRYSKHTQVRNMEYRCFDNYKALEIPFVDAIPNDYDGILAVPISFLDKHCPDQFEIIGRTGDIEWANNSCDFFTPPQQDKQTEYKRINRTWRVQNAYMIVDGKPKTFYDRIFIRYTKSWIKTHNEDFEGGLK